ncbi:MAG: hypothetical protein MMC23_004423 [Stictis urceolatum]|nr:hypothetical protein [Stictis urceolata]
MRVDVTRYRDASYVKPHKKTFYPIKIPIQHHQLRHYISIAEGGIIYYISGCDVWALHTQLRRRERIASLTFQPYCLGVGDGAGFGWLCVGGLNGRCAFIDISEARPFSSGSNPAPAGGAVDGLLPLNLNPQPRDPSEAEEAPAHRPAWVYAKVHTHEMVGEIVNSITMHKMESKFPGLGDEKLAIISSNDRTVQMFSLSQLRTVYTLHFPVQMNHASISPDGNTLVACGDDMRAFFVRRWEIIDRETGPTLFDKFEWAPQFSCQLAATCRPDTCFSTAFSPTGHICTVSSQFGTVTVFDMDKVWGAMEDLEAVVDTFTSSRPAAGHDDMRFIDTPGAIRSTSFSPGPWDLFAWAEDQGRVCVTDLRDGFRSRQLIELDLDSSEFETAEIAETEDTEAADFRELELEAALFRRQRDASDNQDTLASVQSAADYIEHAANRRRRLHEAAGSEVNPHELTETERQILETLRVERLRESSEHNNSPRSGPNAPFSIRYNRNAPHGTSSSSQNTSIHQYMRERNLERTASSGSSRAYNPRRQSSVVIPNSNNQPSTTPIPSTNPSTLAPITGDAISTSPSRLGSSSASNARHLSRLLPSEHLLNGTLIPDPSASDPWGAAPAAAASASSQSSPRPNRSTPSTYSTLLAPSRSHTPATAAPPPVGASAEENRRWRILMHSESERRRRDTVMALRSGTAQRQSSHASGLEQARAQLQLLGNDVEADTEDILRQLQQRIQGTGAATHQLSRTESSHATDAADPRGGDRNTSLSAAAAGAESRPMTWRERAQALIREPRMDAVRLAQYRRLQERAAAAAASGTGVSGDEGFGQAYIENMFGNDRFHGTAVMGMGWGSQGRELYVATEEGIFAFEINIEERKQWPAVKLK